MSDYLARFELELSKDDINEVIPSGYVAGRTLWARIGGPLGIKNLVIQLKKRPEAGTRARSGFLCGVALLARTAERQGIRKLTDKLKKMVESFGAHLDEFARCVSSQEKRVNVNYHKSEQHVLLSVPEPLVDVNFQEWCIQEWPAFNPVPDGIIFLAQKRKSSPEAMDIDEISKKKRQRAASITRRTAKNVLAAEKSVEVPASDSKHASEKITSSFEEDD